jgi:hypothetical protein
MSIGQPSLQVLDFPAGIFKNSTTYENESRWINCDKVRFFQGKPEKFGGWVKENQTQLKGVARDINAWIGLDGNKYLAIATNKKVYLYSGGTFYDITPALTAINLTNPIATTNLSNTVVFTETAHNRNVGDYIILNSVAGSPVGGLTFAANTEYEITAITANTWSIQHASAATSTTSAAGGAVQYTPLLGVGLEFNAAAFGWGGDAYGASTYGTPRSTGVIVDLRQYSLDNWGEDLLVNPRGGPIYIWQPSLGPLVRSARLTAAPQRNNFMKVIHPYRILAAFGTDNLVGGVFDPLLIRWSASEDYTDWTPAATNVSGDFRLEKGNEIIGAELTKNGYLVLTDTTAYEMQYVGYPDAFSFNIVGDKTGCISQQGIVSINSDVYWIGKNGVYRYNGTVAKLECPLQETIFNAVSTNSINPDQKEMVYGGVNQAYSEIIWFYPKKGSTKCDRYFIYNYMENTWYDGSMERSVWEVEGVFPQPFAMSNDSYLYSHEVGKNDDAAPMIAFIESGFFDLGDGDMVMFANKFVPDFSRQNRNVILKLRTKQYPQSSEVFEKSYTLSTGIGQTPIRARGRHMQVRFESNDTDGEFKIGKPRIAVIADGMR